jgi:adenine-specific DNA-methyltransferase
MADKTTPPLELGSTRHLDTRVNIPTEELRDFVAAEEEAPRTTRYPRDPSLDPQLVWRGKDELDREGLEVPVVPIHIHEKIQPQAIIEDLRRNGARGGSGPGLFANYDGFPDDFGKRIDFYHHAGNWQNRMILGDSLLVMASLAEKEGLKGMVQCVYMDPPYGIKFGSNWQASTRSRGVRDGVAEDLTRQPEQVKAFRDTWSHGVNSYMSYLRDRLALSRELLAESGSAFVQIGDENVHLVRCLMDEVFGDINFVSMIIFQTTGGFSTNKISNTCDYILWYAKNIKSLKTRKLYREQNTIPGEGNATWMLLPNGDYRTVTAKEKTNPTSIPKGAVFYKPSNITSQGSVQQNQAFNFKGKIYNPPHNTHWKASYPDGMLNLAYAKRIHVAKNSINYMRLNSDFPYKEILNIWTDTTTGNFTDEKLYVVQTNSKVVERCLLMATDPGDLVLDPTCGSGTTAYVAERRGLRWITCDTSRVALALARTRLMGARFPWYVLAGPGEDLLAEARPASGQTPGVRARGDVRKGFVCKRARHTTLESIANNPDLKEGLTDAEITEAIDRHSRSEILHDQPEVDPKALRVSGPFTVESLSPHRVLPLSDGGADGGAAESGRRKDFAVMVCDNLKAAGVQNTKRGERLTFTRLDLHHGTWIQAVGEYADKNQTVRRIAVALGPEYGTVGPNLVKEAAKEAVRGLGFDTLIICGFAFDPHVPDESTRYGELTVLPVRMNSELLIGKGLLKNTGAGNMFMVFGEPDLEIRPHGAGQFVAELKGVDIYDPTTGEIRSHSTRDVACWFMDTAYDGESFFVRHAYFTGGNEPYLDLRRALRGEIDADAWSSLYSDTSRPFPKPDTGKIAIKVINHFGDEALKIFKL